jgi:hypothetical protein
MLTGAWELLYIWLLLDVGSAARAISVAISVATAGVACHMFPSTAAAVLGHTCTHCSIVHIYC